MALYSTSSSAAVRRWDGVTPGRVVAVRWSPARPSAFFVLDDRCVLSAFDLLSPTPSEPTHVEAFGKREKITSLEFAETAPDERPIAEFLPVAGEKSPRISQK